MCCSPAHCSLLCWPGEYADSRDTNHHLSLASCLQTLLVVFDGAEAPPPWIKPHSAGVGWCLELVLKRNASLLSVLEDEKPISYPLGVNRNTLN